MIVFGTNCRGLWLTLNSSIHEAWVEKFGGLMKTDTTYSPGNCFNNFPLPYDPILANRAELESLTEQLDKARSEIVFELGGGFTDALMKIHDQSNTSIHIQKLRKIRMMTDNAVSAAYGWQDLDLGHGFHKTKQGTRFTISEAARRTVLDSLLELNHQRYAEEVAAGLHEKKAAKATSSQGIRGPKKKDARFQMTLWKS
jgi:hypothetical protein